MKTNKAFIIGTIGVIIGLISAIGEIYFQILFDVFMGNEADYSLAISIIIFSIIGLMGSKLTKTKRKLGGHLMILSTIGLLFTLIKPSLSLFLVIPSAILILIGALIALHKKTTKNKTENNT